MSNLYRNEASFEFDGKEILLRGTFAGCAEMESRAGCSLYEIMIALRSNKATMKQFTAVIYGGLLGSEKLKDQSFEDIGEQVMRTGILKLIIPVMAFVVKCLAGSENVKTEKKTKENRKRKTVRK